MAKQINVCVGGVVKKVSKVSACIGGVVKEMKKGVCGVGGVVKEFYASGFTIFDYGENPYNIRTVNTYADKFASVKSDRLSVSTFTCYSEDAKYPFTSDAMSELTSLDEYNYVKIIADASFFDHYHYTTFVFGSRKETVSVQSKGSAIDDDTASIQTGYYTLTSSNKKNFNTYYATYGAPKISTQWFWDSSTSDGEFYNVKFTDFNVYSISLVSSKG